MSTIHTKYGYEFRKDLIGQNRDAWLKAVGQELEKKGVSIKVGEGSHAQEIKNSDQLNAFFDRYRSNPAQVAQEVGLPAGKDIRSYFSDLMQALDDIVKDTSKVKAGTAVDLRASSELGKALGLDRTEHRYASGYTPFGKATRTEGSTSVLGLLLSRDPVQADPLEGVPFMSATTFAGMRPQVGRNGQEFESVRRLDGLNKDQLVELLRTDRSGRSALDRMQKAKDAEAFTIGYNGMSLDEMRWDSDAHRVREANPHISLTVESGRMELDERSGQHEVSLGTDYNEDTYYDTKDFSLLNNDMSVRARIRRDEPTPEPSGVRRVLIQSKVGSNVDESGMKAADKADVRKDNPSEADVNGLDETIRSGMSTWEWGGTPKPIEAMGIVYNALNEKGALPDIGEHKDVLLLEDKAHVRSTRSRFHLNETSRSSTVDLFRNTGEPKIRETLDLLQKGGFSGPEADKIRQLGTSLLDRSAFVERCKDKLIALDPSLAQSGVTLDTLKQLWPDNAVTANKLEAAKRDVVANEIQSAYDEFSALMDNSRRDIAGARGPESRGMNFPAETLSFMRERYPELKKIQTVGPFLQKFDQILAGPDKDAFIQDLSKYANDNGKNALQNATDKDAAMRGLRTHLVNEHLDILHRQIEASGTSACTLSFDNMRKAYAGNDRTNWNFLIDTFDVSEYYTPETWKNLTPEERSGAKPVSPDKMFHATVVNEVQIELGYEKPFVEAIEKAQAAVQNARGGLFMDYAVERGLAKNTDAPATFHNLLRETLAKPKSEQDAFFSALNDFAKARGSALTFDANTSQPLGETAFSASNLNQDGGKHTQLLEDQRMTEFVWGEFRRAQEFIADLRGNRVTREADRAGFSTKWVNSEMSKGDLALTLLRDGRP
ncbi:hypothetical protein L6R29_06665 [Myxococcota bacterium]|nr:hypothetical protein [Myxococcota bacterium]